MVGRMVLVHEIQVRILVRQHAVKRVLVARFEPFNLLCLH